MEDSQDDKPSRNRCSSFSQQEVTALLNLIEKYKQYILNKSVTSGACQAKEAAWNKVMKLFNKQDLGPARTTDNLKTKWSNLKRNARKVSRGSLDSKCLELNTFNANVVSLISDSENMTAGDLQEFEDVDDNDNDSDQKELEIPHFLDEDCEKQTDSENSDKGLQEDNARIKSMSFSPRECKILLQCVRKEKKQVFCKDLSAMAIELKNKAWNRISHSYNKLSPQKRSAKVLRTKFTNMKSMAKRVGLKTYLRDLGGNNKQERLLNDTSKKIKEEPSFNYKSNTESDRDEVDMHDDDECDFRNDSNISLPPQQCVERVDIDYPNDPLSSVLRSDSGIGSSSADPWNPSEDKEVVKLKLELLNYQMENVKLERKRLEEAMKDDALTRESRTIEASLRLRAARLDAVAAAAKFTSAHPALLFAPEEASAQRYLNQYHQT